MKSGKNSFSSSLSSKIYTILLSILLIMIAGFLVVSNWRILGKTMDSIKFRQAAEVNLKTISDREGKLASKLDDLQTENGLDKEIRKRFPVAKPGEEVIMIVPGDNSEATSGSSVGSGKNWWQNFLDFFKK